MSTRSTIEIVRKDGSRQRIYAHWNGYLAHNGHILYHKYDTAEKVEELIALGNISSLGDTPDECMAYHRDGYEDLKFWENDEEYNYSFNEKTGIWTVRFMDSNHVRVEMPLGEALEKYKCLAESLYH